MSNRVVSIGDVKVGDGHPAVFMAELGTFFNRDVELAISYIDRAVKAGVRVIKSEVLHTPEVCIRDTGLIHAYKHVGGTTEEDYWELMSRKVLSFEQYRKIFSRCHELNVPYVASVYTIEGIDFLVEQGCAGIKIARDKLNNLPLIRHSAQTGLPIIFDAGGVAVDEIADALRTAREAGAKELVINHHPGSEPVPASNHHLNVIGTYKQMFNIPIGLSCHFQGDLMLYAAIGAGASLLEKGLVEDPDIDEQAILVASSFKDLPKILENVALCGDAMGSAEPQQEKAEPFASCQCVVAKRDIQSGETLGLDNLSFAFPAVGISVGEWDAITGKQATRDIKQREIIQWTDMT